MSAIVEMSNPNGNHKSTTTAGGYRLVPASASAAPSIIVDVTPPPTPASPASSQTLTFPVTGQNVRTVIIEGKVWFVARDVAGCLGYADVVNAIKLHCKKSNKFKGGKMPPSASPINIIPESDVYRLVMRSKLPTAEAFQDWVVEEVLPSLRQHGHYGLQPAPTAHPAATAIDASAIIAHLDARLDAIQADIAPLQDKARRFHQFLDTEGSYNLTQAAKHFGMTAVELGELLREPRHQWLFRKNGRTGHNTPTQYAIGKGYMELKSVKNSQTGYVAAQARFTPKGLDALYDLLGKLGRV